MEPDCESLLIEATNFFTALRAAQVQMPEGSRQRQLTGQLAHTVDDWCRYVEDNNQHWRRESA